MPHVAAVYSAGPGRADPRAALISTKLAWESAWYRDEQTAGERAAGGDRLYEQEQEQEPHGRAAERVA